MNSSGNQTEESCPQPLSVGHGVALVIINSLSSIAGTMGNILVCLAVIANRRRQRSASNYLLMSLAIADLVVTMFSQPTVVAMIIKRHFFHQCAQLLYQLYIASSYISCSSSLFHLTMISIDRAGNVLRPVQHIAFMKATGWKIFVGISWGAATVSCLASQIFKKNKATRYYVTTSVFFVSYTVIIVCYSLILIRLGKEERKWRGKSRRKHSSTTDIQVEKRVATTIAIVIAIFTVCWLPMIVTFFAKGQPLIQVNGPAFMWIKTLFLCNSSMNFIIYTWRLHEFRQVYWNIVRCKTLKQEGRNVAVETRV